MSSTPIKLGHKEVAMCEINPEIRKDWPCTHDLGAVDLGPLKAKLESYGDAVWSIEGQPGNVTISRPGHDRWGVGKVVFVFCDDFIHRVFHMPWWREWAPIFEPLFKSIGVNPSSVVRCLMARLPPGVSIPPHHDTGHWVTQSHRVHIPVYTNDGVHFGVGQTDETMQRVVFPESRAMELNNRSKHSVANNGEQPRVHLIFDWVEPDLLKRLNTVKVSSEDKIVQTRRSVDLEKERKKFQVPHFLIIGAQKAGTTSLYSYICDHPWVVPGKRKEPHYLDWRWDAECGDARSQMSIRMHRRAYANAFYKKELSENPSLVTGDATPSYLLGGATVIVRAKLIMPQVKILVMLRDPVARAYSHYIMTTDPVGTEKQLINRGKANLGDATFDDIVERELKALEEAGITPESTPKEFDAAVCKKTPAHGGHSFLARGLYALQLEMWFMAFPRERFMVLELKQDLNPDTVHATVKRAWEHIGIPPHHVPSDLEHKNKRSYEKMKPETHERLVRFFHPYNQRLYKLMGKDYGWAAPAESHE